MSKQEFQVAPTYIFAEIFFKVSFIQLNQQTKNAALNKIKVGGSFAH